MALKHALVPAAAFLASCGLLDATPTLPFPADGIGDFGDATLVEVCIGPAKVVSPSVAAGIGGSICIGAGTEGTSCTRDKDCSGSTERCLCGRCIIEPCLGAGACPAGRSCRGNRCTRGCVTDDECGGTDVCVGGGCARPCSSDGECSFGERCDPLNLVCAAEICSPAILCAVGDTCETSVMVADLHEPNLVDVGGDRVGFVEVRPPAGASAIYRLDVGSTTRWAAKPAQPVVTSTKPLGAPSALATDAGLELYFAVGDGASIGHAISHDGGASFEAQDLTVLSPAEPWEKGWVGSPSALVFQGKTVLFYEGGPRAGIGVATIEGGKAVRSSKKPIATPASIDDPYFWRGVSAVRAPSAFVVGDVLRVYFTGRGAEGTDAIVNGEPIPADMNDSIGMIATRDLVTFDRYPDGPVFARLVNLRAFLGETEAWVGSGAGGKEIVFVSTDASGSVSNGLARAISR